MLINGFGYSAAVVSEIAAAAISFVCVFVSMAFLRIRLVADKMMLGAKAPTS